MDHRSSNQGSSIPGPSTPEENLYDEWKIIPKTQQRLPGQPPEFNFLLQKPLGSPSDVIFEVLGFLDQHKGYTIELNGVAYTRTGQEDEVKKYLIARVRWRQIAEPKSDMVLYEFPLVQIPSLGFLQAKDGYKLEDFVKTRDFGRTVAESKDEGKIVEMVSLVHPLTLQPNNSRKERKIYLRSTATSWPALNTRRRILYGFVDYDINTASADASADRLPDFTMTYEENTKISGKIRIRRGAFNETDKLDHLIIFILFLDLLDWNKGDLKIKLDRRNQDVDEELEHTT
ncbi:hypothetical protein CPB84DRAFT_1851876 [Gymnopilus junonius]|uniref:Uncharacterized protein n=1 Tax=Gymnopilus junonius TaxID=109634 RepID=A0A9P5TII4_GYMJU|nr:hypothetical protein CPB84DRAFT_1851876 [Gymnopilus junonius]